MSSILGSCSNCGGNVISGTGTPEMGPRCDRCGYHAAPKKLPEIKTVPPKQIIKETFLQE